MANQKKKTKSKKGLTRRQVLKYAGGALAYSMVQAPFVHAKSKPTLKMISQEPDPGTVKFFEESFAGI